MAGGDEVKLLGSPVSPFSARARIALNLKVVPYMFLPQNFNDKSELLLKSNPVYKKVPVLIHRGKPICESMIIVQYIDQVWPSADTNILPGDPYDRSIARFWAAYIDDKLYPCMLGTVLTNIEEAKAAATEQLYAGLLLLEEAFKKCSNGKEFFGGDAIGYLDIALGCFLGWLEVAGKLSGVEFVYEGKTPLLAGWAERFRFAEAVKGTSAEVNELLEFAKALQAKYGAATAAAA